MTTLKDLLKDFQDESIKIGNPVYPFSDETIKQELELSLDELVDQIKERLIG